MKFEQSGFDLTPFTTGYLPVTCNGQSGANLTPWQLLPAGDRGSKLTSRPVVRRG